MNPYNPTGYIIHIPETALMQMCLSGLEAYSVVHKGNTGHKSRLETYALLFGTEAELPNGKTFFSIELLSVDTSAEMNHNSTTPNLNALELKRDILTSFFPQHDFIGDFHTHPYSARLSYADVKKQRLYNFSDQDRLHILSNSKMWIQHNYRVGLVLTIALLKKQMKDTFRQIENSLIEFTLGNYRLWLKGSVAALDEDEEEMMLVPDSEITLRCPSSLGQGECSRFGKLIGRAHRPVEI